MKLHLAIGLIGSALTFSAAAADRHVETMTRGTVLSVPEPSRKPHPVLETPVRGMSKAEVIAVFGPPVQRHEPVGEPPITRWDYRQFSVFFEYDTVLHSVVPSQPTQLYHRDQLVSGD